MVSYGPSHASPFPTHRTGPARDERRHVSDQNISDENLERRVRNYLSLRHIDGLESIRFTVVNGNVLLRGAVSTPSTKWRICEGCRHVAGVLNVIDRLIVTPGLQAPLAAVSCGG